MWYWKDDGEGRGQDVLGQNKAICCLRGGISAGGSIVLIHPPDVELALQAGGGNFFGSLTDLFPQRLHIVCDLLWRLPKLAVPLPTTCRMGYGQLSGC